MILSELHLLSDLHYFLRSYEYVGIFIFFILFFFMMGCRSAECHECSALLSGWWITRRFKAPDPFQPDYTAAVNGDTFRHSSHWHVRTWMASVLSVAAAFLWHEDTELVLNPRHLTLPQRLDHLAKGYCYVFSRALEFTQRSEPSRLRWQA